MDVYPWWSEEHKAFQKEIKAFVEEVMPIDAETRWTRQFPCGDFQKNQRKGLYGRGRAQGIWRLGAGSHRRLHCSGGV